MIRITIELLPHGLEEGKAVLGSGRIWNDISGSSTSGNYAYELFTKSGTLWKSGKIKNFPRKRLLVWDLLYRCLRDAIGERNAEHNTK